MDDCVASESHRHKKATFGKRVKRVNVVMLKRIPSRVPKGIHRKRLKEDGWIIEVGFHRNMTSKMTLQLIADAFKEVCQVKNLEFYQANRDNTLQVHQDQELDGSGVLNLAGSGSLYVHQMEESEGDQQDQPCTSASISSPEGEKRKMLFQRADELIKALRVSFLLPSVCMQREGIWSVCLCVCLCVHVVQLTSGWLVYPT